MIKIVILLASLAIFINGAFANNQKTEIADNNLLGITALHLRIENQESRIRELELSISSQQEVIAELSRIAEQVRDIKRQDNSAGNKQQSSVIVKVVVFRNLCHFSIIKKKGMTHDSIFRLQQSIS